MVATGVADRARDRIALDAFVPSNGQTLIDLRPSDERQRLLDSAKTGAPKRVRRLKNGSPATHPLTGKELRALRRLQREQCAAGAKSPFASGLTEIRVRDLPKSCPGISETRIRSTISSRMSASEWQDIGPGNAWSRTA